MKRRLSSEKGVNSFLKKFCEEGTGTKGKRKETTGNPVSLRTWIAKNRVYKDHAGASDIGSTG